jgi:cytoskeletal protein CcmA (bactofilin family)
MFNKSSDTPNQMFGTHFKSNAQNPSVPEYRGQKEQGVNMDKKFTVIAEGTVLNGNLRSEESVQIDGTFEGDLNVKGTLIVGPNATVQANINAGEVKISGKVNGNIIAKERLEICSSGKLYGDIKTPRLTIAEGVVFEGHCSMGTDKKSDDLNLNNQQVKASLV